MNNLEYDFENDYKRFNSSLNKNEFIEIQKANLKAVVDKLRETSLFCEVGIDGYLSVVDVDGNLVNEYTSTMQAFSALVGTSCVLERDKSDVSYY